MKIFVGLSKSDYFSYHNNRRGIFKIGRILGINNDNYDTIVPVFNSYDCIKEVYGCYFLIIENFNSCLEYFGKKIYSDRRIRNDFNYDYRVTTSIKSFNNIKYVQYNGLHKKLEESFVLYFLTLEDDIKNFVVEVIHKSKEIEIILKFEYINTLKFNSFTSSFEQPTNKFKLDRSELNEHFLVRFEHIKNQYDLDYTIIDYQYDIFSPRYNKIVLISKYPKSNR
ncbi:hypothetical protein [Flavobacterium aestuarii]|uniref:hypothetical protein n=1 Tax=Flavobacterium aestuarii TaxID=3149227 RepID=UPI0032B5C820